MHSVCCQIQCLNYAVHSYRLFQCMPYNAVLFVELRDSVRALWQCLLHASSRTSCQYKSLLTDLISLLSDAKGVQKWKSPHLVTAYCECVWRYSCHCAHRGSTSVTVHTGEVQLHSFFTWHCMSMSEWLASSLHHLVYPKGRNPGNDWIWWMDTQTGVCIVEKR
jgi:hypothetical protein